MTGVMRDIVIVGAGGSGKEILPYAKDFCAATSGYRIKGFVDSDPLRHGTDYCGIPVIGSDEGCAIGAADVFLLALGTPEGRKRAVAVLQERGAAFLTLVHPLACVAPSAEVRTGSVIYPFAYLGPDAVVDEFVLVNHYASCGHDVRVGRYAVLGPYACMNGHVTIEDEVFLGTHTTVTVGKRVGRGSTVAAGGVVVQDVPPGVLAAGNPVAWRKLEAFQAVWKQRAEGRPRQVAE